MPSENQTAAARIFSVYWRCRDGRGTHVWKEGLTKAECEAETRWCEGAHPEATLVWAARGNDSNAYKLKVKTA